MSGAESLVIRIGDEMKTCFKCGEEKELDMFYPHPRMKDGHLNKCIECTKRDVKERRFGPSRESILMYERQRAKLPHRVEKNKTTGIEYKESFPERRSAQSKLWAALRKGTVVKLPCLVCGDEKSEAHHPDYSSPLDVVWLCPAHHKQAHAISKRAA